MESTSTPDHGRQSRGLSRFWPVHGTPAPEQRQPDDAGTPEPESDAGSPEGGSSGAALSGGSSGAALSGGSAGAALSGGSSVALSGGAFPAADAGPVAGSGSTGEQPQVDAVRPSLRAGETQMVALGSRRLPEIVNGRPPGQGGFPPPETEREERAAEPGPRHGGPPIPTALPLPPSRLPFGTGPENESFRAPASPLGSGSPFGPASPFGPRPARGSSGDGGGRDPRAGTPPRHDDAGRRDSAVGPDRIGEDRRRRDSQRSRAAQGWATLPTSGIPTLAGRPTIDEAVADAPVAGSPADRARSASEDAAEAPDARSRPFGGIAGDSADDGSRTPDGNAGDNATGRRGRDGEPHVVAPRRSTTLDDADEPRPHAGRRAAPGTADEVDDRSPDAEAGGADAVPDASTMDVATPDGTSANDGRDDNSEAGAAAEAATGRDGTTEVEAGRDGALPAGTDRDDTGMADSGRDETAPAGAGVTADTDSTSAETGGADPATAGAPVAGDARPNAEDRSDTPLRPGDVEETLIVFWDDKAIERFRGEWHEVKADFVDDPVAALTRAHDLITEAVDDLSEALLAERDQLDPLRTTSTPDTESMRMAMRGYREFLDRILAL